MHRQRYPKSGLACCSYLTRLGYPSRSLTAHSLFLHTAPHFASQSIPYHKLDVLQQCHTKLSDWMVRNDVNLHDFAEHVCNDVKLLYPDVLSAQTLSNTTSSGTSEMTSKYTTSTPLPASLLCFHLSRVSVRPLTLQPLYFLARKEFTAYLYVPLSITANKSLPSFRRSAILTIVNSRCPAHQPSDGLSADARLLRIPCPFPAFNFTRTTRLVRVSPHSHISPGLGLNTTTPNDFHYVLPFSILAILSTSLHQTASSNPNTSM